MRRSENRRARGSGRLDRLDYAQMRTFYRDRAYRPGRSNTIVDDFAVMPRIPDSAFRPHLTIEQYQDISIRTQEEEQPEFEPNDYEDVDVPIGNRRPDTPTDGYDGKPIGMERCSECKTWCDGKSLRNNKCSECQDEDNKVNSRGNTENNPKSESRSGK